MAPLICCCVSSLRARAARASSSGPSRSAARAFSATSTNVRRRASDGSAPISIARSSTISAISSPARPHDSCAGSRRRCVRPRTSRSTSGRRGYATTSGHCAGPSRSRPSCCRTTPTLTPSHSLRTNSRRPCSSFTCAAAGYAGGFFRAVCGQIRPCRAEQVFIAIRAAVLPGQCLIHTRRAVLVALARQRVGVIQGWGRFGAGTEARTTCQCECGRGNRGQANNPSRYMHLLKDLWSGGRDRGL